MKRAVLLFSVFLMLILVFENTNCIIADSPRISLRSEPLTVSSYEEARKMFGLDKDARPLKYILNDFETRGDVVIDHATGLMWQKSGSPMELTYKAAHAYVEELNRQRFAGYNDWRLPTIPELMTLVEREKLRTTDLHICSTFDTTQIWCWSADKHSSESAWIVFFGVGGVSWHKLFNPFYVRCVRSIPKTSGKG